MSKALTTSLALSMKALSLRSSPSLPRSSSPSLPEEIVSEVLVLTCNDYDPNALLDLHLLRASATPATSPYTVVLNPKTARKLSAQTRLLCNYGLVSRTWSNATLPLLYAHVILLSHQQALLFARTLKSSPALARMTKEISYVILAASKFNLLRWLRIQMQDEPAGEFLPSDVYSLASFIVHACQNFKAFHLCMPEEHKTFPNHGIFTPGVSGGGLRELTVHGHVAFYAISSPVLPSFPLLEVLCFHKTVAGASFALPYLPRLHTLRLIKASMWCLSAPMGSQILVPENIPGLRSLHLHGSALTEESFHSQVSEFFPSLRTLSTATSHDISAFCVLSTSNALLNLEHLTIGQLDQANHPLASWRVSPSLKSLTLLCRVSAHDPSMQPLFQFLQLNEQSLSRGICSLQRVIINAYWFPNQPPHFIDLAVALS